MFNLGQKSIIINRDALVTEVASVGGAKGVISIEGYGKFMIPTVAEAGARTGVVTASASAALGVYTVTLTGYDDTATYDVELAVRSERAISNMKTDYDRWSFQTKANSGSAGASLVAGQIAGFNDDRIKFGGTTTPTITFQAGMEGVSLEKFIIRNAVTGVELVVSTAVNTAPSYGLGLGRIIEEEVQNSTYENIAPEAIGGKEQVDLRGTYTEISWECVAIDDDNEGWAPHESLGYGDANTEATHGTRQYIAYVNETSAADTIALLTKLTTGEAIVA